MILDTCPRTSVFVDKFCFTTPGDDTTAVDVALKNIFDSLGCTDIHGGKATASGSKYFRKHSHAVTTHTFSGSILTELREHGLMAELLAMVSLLPSYRLTRADLTVDFSVDGTEVLPSVIDSAKQGHIRVSRKFDKVKDVVYYLSPSYRVPDKDTGTVYIGSPKAERRLKVYDKAQERFSRHSIVVMPTTRVELTLTCKTGITMRDLSQPDSIYYHYVPNNLLTRPSGVSDWLPTEPIGGYSLEKRGTVTPYARATHLLKGIEPALRAIHKLSMEDPTRSESFQSLIESRISRILHGA